MFNYFMEKASNVVNVLAGASAATQSEENGQNLSQRKPNSKRNNQKSNNIKKTKPIPNNNNVRLSQEIKQEEFKIEGKKESNITFNDKIELSDDKDSFFFDKTDQSSSDSDISLSELPSDWNSNDYKPFDKHIYWNQYQASHSDKYCGTLTNDKKKDGLGIIDSAECQYIGQWEQDKKKGYGCYLVKTKEKKYHAYGQWDNDKLVNGYVYQTIQAIKIPPKLKPYLEKKIINISYKGAIKDDKWNGLGALRFIVQFKKYAIDVKIEAKWKNSFIEYCSKNTLILFKTQLVDELIKSIKIAFEDQSKIANIHILGEILAK
ncbi:MAG: hypothetical protein K2Q14_07855, partial [Gammaproteobacteria bacterium]|nr:hypothetical protein [Gammaproteobacteria bacterium]